MIAGRGRIPIGFWMRPLGIHSVTASIAFKDSPHFVNFSLLRAGNFAAEFRDFRIGDGCLAAHQDRT